MLLQAALASAGFICDAAKSVAFAELKAATCLDADPSTLRGKSIVVRTGDQMTAALALLELHGVARRLVLCPPDVQPGQLDIVIADSEADGLVVGREAPNEIALPAVTCGPPRRPRACTDSEPLDTEWVLLTSGTTGSPKMVAHRLRALCASFGSHAGPHVWGTFYDIRRYGGLQMLLRAALGGGSMVLSQAGEPASDHLARLASRGVTHMSGTPSHWRRVLQSPERGCFRPRYVRLSGEIADQAVLDALAREYPDALIEHAYASTECGVAFEVDDGKEGFPAAWIGARRGEVELEVAEGRLRIRSTGAAERYLGRGGALSDERGFIASSDLIERRGDRFRFAGRGDGVVNVGGLKVHPEEVEQVINDHEAVRLSLVKGRRNPLTGEIVVADVLLRQPESDGAKCRADDARSRADDEARLRADIMDFCRSRLPPHKVPAMIRFVESLELSAGGKLARAHA